MKLLTKTNTLTASLLALTLAVTGCANTNTNSNHHAKAGAMPHKQMPKDAHHHQHDGHKMGEMRGHHFERLNLTDAQQKQLEALKKQNHGKMQQLHTKAKQQDETIAKQREAKASTATLLALYQQKQATMDEMKALHDASEKQFMAILTPEQQLQMYQAHDDRKEKRQEKREQKVEKGERKQGEKPMPKPDMPPMPMQPQVK
ncbi:Spy/CpxP family protein refolding chaperone [Moraxella boevrei]|uniref:Spy/CpxP family protein refolding chaperone n=1 Tax=Faucicola boevrei TaxID=346665 RepID=UPI003736D39A